MFTKDRSFVYQHQQDNPAVTLLDVEPQQLTVNLATSLPTCTILPQKKVPLNVSEDLIHFKDDCTITRQQPLKIDKSKQITDYQLKMLEEFLSTTGHKSQKSNLTPEQELEFQKFFDKYESNNLKSFNGNNHITVVQNEGASSSKLHVNYVDNTGNVIPKNINENIMYSILSEDNSKKPLKTIEENNYNAEKLLQCNNIMWQINQTDKETDKSRKIMDEIITKNYINYAAFKPHENPLPKNGKVITDAINLNYNKSSVSIPDIADDYSKVYNSAKINELVTKHDLRYLETKTKDEKLFKKSELLTENEKLKLTPGPTLYEKSVVLPQIMHRLGDRKLASEKSQNDKRKLILNTGLSYSSIPAQHNIMKDGSYKCVDPSKENVKQKLILGPGSSHNLKQNNDFNGLRTEVTKPSAGDATPFRQDLTLTTKKEPEDIKESKEKCIYPSVESLRKLRQSLITEHENNELLDAESPRVLRPPVVLTENCNRDRYVAYATSRLFDDFIRTGK